VDLQRLGAVLELVALRHGLVRQLAGLAQRHEPGAEVVGDRGGDDEAAGLDADDLVDRAAPEADHDGVDRAGEGDGVGQQRGDVLEHHPLLGEVGDVADGLAQGGGVELDAHGRWGLSRLGRV